MKRKKGLRWNVIQLQTKRQKLFFSFLLEFLLVLFLFYFNNFFFVCHDAVIVKFHFLNWCNFLRFYVRLLILMLIEMIWSNYWKSFLEVFSWEESALCGLELEWCGIWLMLRWIWCSVINKSLLLIFFWDPKWLDSLLA